MASRVLVTGAGGLIGRHVLQAFRGSVYSVMSLSDVVPGTDLLDPGVPTALVEALRPDAVLHLAWVASGTMGYRNHADNELWVRSTLELTKACLNRGVWMIGTGSVIELEAEPADAYARAKIAAWKAVQGRVNQGQLTWLRPYFVFDPHSGSPAVLAEVQRAVAAREVPVLTTPTATHDFIHARDVGTAIRTVIEGNLRGLIPIAYGHEHSVAQLVAGVGVPGMGERCGRAETGRPVPGLSRLIEKGWYPRWTEEFFHD